MSDPFQPQDPNYEQRGRENFAAPAMGERFLARGRVVKPGRTLTNCAGEVVALDADGSEIKAAIIQTTMMGLAARAG